LAAITVADRRRRHGVGVVVLPTVAVAPSGTGGAGNASSLVVVAGLGALERTRVRPGDSSTKDNHCS
jgi:hypothetical protein